MNPGDFPAWGVDWAWGMPIIIVTVIFHAYFLGLVNRRYAKVKANCRVSVHIRFGLRDRRDSPCGYYAAWVGGICLGDRVPPTRY